MEKKSNYQGGKLPDHPVRAGQARGGHSIPRFAGPTALSMWNGLSGHAVASRMRAKEASLILCPPWSGLIDLTRLPRFGGAGHVPVKNTVFLRRK